MHVNEQQGAVVVRGDDRGLSNLSSLRLSGRCYRRWCTVVDSDAGAWRRVPSNQPTASVDLRSPNSRMNLPISTWLCFESHAVGEWSMPVANVEQLNVVAEAITFAIEGMSRLPDPHRSESNIAELQQVLRSLAPTNLTNLQSVARSSVDILLGIRPQDPRDFA